MLECILNILLHSKGAKIKETVSIKREYVPRYIFLGFSISFKGFSTFWRKKKTLPSTFHNETNKIDFSAVAKWKKI